MSTPLAGKVALVTGGSKGIGASLALRLAELGADVAINFSSDSQPADEVVAQINQKSRGFAIKGDAGSVDGTEAIVQAVVNKFQKIDILVPNAGILLLRDLSSASEADFDRSYALNVKGPLFLAQKAVPYMPKGSSIVFMSSSLCHTSNVSPPYLIYCSTKGAIEQLTRLMAKDLGTKGINVNCVAPGPTATALFLGSESEEHIAAVGRGSPYGRIGQPPEIADAIAMLCGEQARWVTGQLLKVNGGTC